MIPPTSLTSLTNNSDNHYICQLKIDAKSENWNEIESQVESDNHHITIVFHTLVKKIMVKSVLSNNKDSA